MSFELASGLKDVTNEMKNQCKDCIPDFIKSIESKINSFEEADKPLVDNKYKGCPVEGGKWEGERGESKWFPNIDESPNNPLTNPDKLTWGEILEKNGIDSITFKEGKPYFEVISKETVEIEGFSDKRDINFKKADIETAKIRGCTPQEVKAWREENKYTWHEREDCKTIDKIPREVHGNIPHSGGISEYKKNEGE